MLGLMVVSLVLMTVGTWLVGDIALRLVGGLTMVIGLLVLAPLSATLTVLPISLLIIAGGLVLWLAGHWLRAVKIHSWSSRIARGLLVWAGGERMDPTRNWEFPADYVGCGHVREFRG